MNRKEFILAGLGFLTVGLIDGRPFPRPFGAEKIRDCRDCRKQKMCCETPNESFALLVSIWEKTIIKKQGEKHKVNIGRFENFDVGNFIWQWIEHRCPFLKDRRCLIYKQRPSVCRKYYCEDWGLTSAEQDSINQKVDREWNRGKNAD